MSEYPQRVAVVEGGKVKAVVTVDSVQEREAYGEERYGVFTWTLAEADSSSMPARLQEEIIGRLRNSEEAEAGMNACGWHRASQDAADLAETGRRLMARTHGSGGAPPGLGNPATEPTGEIFLFEGIRAGEVATRTAKETATLIARGIFKVGDEPDEPCTRIQFKVGSWIEKTERDAGGLCEESLANQIEVILNRLNGSGGAPPGLGGPPAQLPPEPTTIEEMCRALLDRAWTDECICCDLERPLDTLTSGDLAGMANLLESYLTEKKCAHDLAKEYSKHTTDDY